MSDPLDVLFVSHDEAIRMQLAREIKQLPRELQILFSNEFQKITRAELASLRAAAAECDEWKQRHAMLLDVEVGFIRERDRLQAVVTAQAAQLEQALTIFSKIVNDGCSYPSEIDGDPTCFFCGTYQFSDKKHDDDCIFVLMQALISANAPAPEAERTA